MTTSKQVRVGSVTGYFNTYGDEPGEEHTTTSTISWASLGEVTCREAREFAKDIHTVLEVLGQWTDEYKDKQN